MFEAIFERQPSLLVPVVAITGSAIVSIVWIVAHYWKRVRQIDVETSLKQDMLNRGLSAVEIERVLWASSDGPQAPPSPEAQEMISDNEYYLVEKMLDEERSVEEIERLIRSFKGERATAIKTIAAIREA
jgi:hypothetical protein